MEAVTLSTQEIVIDCLFYLRGKVTQVLTELSPKAKRKLKLACVAWEMARHTTVGILIVLAMIVAAANSKTLERDGAWVGGG